MLLFVLPRGHVTSMSFRKLNFQLIKCSAFHLLASKDLNCVAFQCFNYGRTRKGFQKMRHLCILKISNGQSESVNRRTDNTMAKRNEQKDKQHSTKHTHKTKERITRTPLKTGVELGCSGRAGST